MDSREILLELMKKNDSLMDAIATSDKQLTAVEEENEVLRSRQNKIEEAIVAVYEELLASEDPDYVATIQPDVNTVKKFLKRKR